MAKSTILHEVDPEELADALAAKLAERTARQKMEVSDAVLRRLKFVTIDQVATIAAVSRSTVHTWMNAGRLVPVKTNKKERFRLCEVLELVRFRDDKKAVPGS